MGRVYDRTHKGSSPVDVCQRTAEEGAEAALFVSSAEELCGNRNSLVGDLLQILAQDLPVASKEVTARPTPTQKAIWKLRERNPSLTGLRASA
jgi:hypothetical protein